MATEARLVRVIIAAPVFTLSILPNEPDRCYVQGLGKDDAKRTIIKNWLEADGTALTRRPRGATAQDPSFPIPSASDEEPTLAAAIAYVRQVCDPQARMGGTDYQFELEEDGPTLSLLVMEPQFRNKVVIRRIDDHLAPPHMDESTQQAFIKTLLTTGYTDCVKRLADTAGFEVILVPQATADILGTLQVFAALYPVL